jgi:hypothetical protein
LTTETTQVNKSTKTYDELLTELDNLWSKAAEMYIPELCMALIRKHPMMLAADVKARVLSDVCPRFWTEDYARHYWPKWLNRPYHKPENLETISKSAPEVKRSRELDIVRTTTQQLSKPKPTQVIDEPIDDDNADSFIDNEAEDAEPRIETRSDGRTPLQKFAAINLAQSQLWTALTNKENMPHVHDDLTTDHIKPTRRYRTSLIHELDSMEQTGLARRCQYLIALLEDTVQSIQTIQEKSS